MTRIGRSLHPRGRTPSISYEMLAETCEISTANDLKQRQRMSRSRHTSLALCSSHRPARAFQICETPRCHPTAASSFRDKAMTPQQPRSSSEQEHVTGLRKWLCCNQSQPRPRITLPIKYEISSLAMKSRSRSVATRKVFLKLSDLPKLSRHHVPRRRNEGADALVRQA
jgi:hypothetical protein